MLKSHLQKLLSGVPEITGVAIVGQDGIPLEIMTRGDFDESSPTFHRATPCPPGCRRRTRWRSRLLGRTRSLGIPSASEDSPLAR